MSLDHPQYDLKACLYELSKNLKGRLRQIKEDSQSCTTPSTCATLKTKHELNVQVKTTGSPCDSARGRKLDGRLVVKELIHGLINDGLGRGYHRGYFWWFDTATSLIAEGTISGITNAGTHRKPLNDCELCNIQGHMEGQIVGRIRKGPLKGCEIYGIYLFSFNPSTTFNSPPVTGTLEGVIECVCT
jgi:hypothetical protein